MIYTALDTFYVTQEQITNSPSRKDGVDEKTETMLRRFGCDLIQESGILMRLPQAVMATGQVLFHRFYCKKSFARFNVKRVAASCVWLAAKLEESPRKIREVLLVFNRMERRRGNLPLEFLEPTSQKYEEVKTDLIRTERHLLKEMGFICHVEHPHKFIISYLKVLETPSELMQVAWNLANDSLRTTLCVRFKSEAVACGVVYAAARKFKVPLPDRWWEVFDAKWSDVDTVCKVLADLYRQPEGCYIEVGRESKSFVLTSKAWDIPAEVQEGLIKTMANGAASVEQVQTATSSGSGLHKDTASKGPGDRLKSASAKDGAKDLEEVRASNTNGELRDDPSVGKEKSSCHIEEESGDKNRDMERERERQKVRENRDSGREWGGEREREAERIRGRGRDRDRERRDKERDWDDRENTSKRDYRRKERSRDLGHAEKTRPNLISREREFQVVREKEPHHHHQRQNKWPDRTRNMENGAPGYKANLDGTCRQSHAAPRPSEKHSVCLWGKARWMLLLFHLADACMFVGFNGKVMAKVVVAFGGFKLKQQVQMNKKRKFGSYQYQCGGISCSCGSLHSDAVCLIYVLVNLLDVTNVLRGILLLYFYELLILQGILQVF